MNPAASRRPSLAGAHERLAVLLDELNVTVDLAERLTRLGEPESALRLIDEQRAALYAAIDEVAHEVAIPRSRRQALRRATRGMVAAAAVLILSAAVAVGVVRTHEPSLIEQAHAQITQAQRVADPVVKLKIIERVVLITRQLPPGEEKARLAHDALPEIEKIKQDAPNPKESDTGADMLLRAETLERELEDARAPGDGSGGTQPPPPSTGQTPIDELNTVVDYAPPSD